MQYKASIPQAPQIQQTNIEADTILPPILWGCDGVPHREVPSS